MPATIEGRTVYRIGEALKIAGVSRATYFRWVRQGRMSDTQYRDRNSRRVFTEAELQELERVANHLVDATGQMKLPLELGTTQ